MKKYIIIVCLLVAAWLGWDAAHYRLGVYVDLTPHNYATAFSRADRDAIYLDRGNGFEAFEIRGIDLGAGEPGEWATDYGIEEETYLRWFQQMKEMGANTVRVYSIQSEPFDCYEDIMASGCAGSCVFSWQDEWFKRTWNTMYAVDLTRTPYWSDYQTNEQYFGLLSFDPGKEASVCYVDGDLSEWTDADIISEADGMTLSMKYDEKFIYLMLEKEQLAFGSAPLYIAFDITPKSGTEYSADHHLNFDRCVDFVLTLDGENNSRLQVQERYEALRSTYAQETYQYDTYLRENIPAADSNHFSNIDMILLTATVLLYHDQTAAAETFETGLLTYGNANPSSPDFNSLADFICSGDAIEIKLPWQLLNFADPSRMMIHDDYYDGNYGVEFIQIDKIFIGAGMADTIHLSSVPLTGWNNKVTYHERLKDSYYMMQDLWNPDF